MASMGGGHLDPQKLIRKAQSKTLLNKHLQSICTRAGLGKGGVKAELQTKIIRQIDLLAKINDTHGLEQINSLLDNPMNPPLNAYGMASGSSSAAQSPAPMPANPYSTAPINGNYNMGGGGLGYSPYGHPRIEFRNSPYYEIKEQVTQPLVCEIMANHRHTVKINLKATESPMLLRLSSDPTLRVMVFCAMEGVGKQDIAFPHQSELRVNEGEVKANLRGLKSKPGSTRPVDITKELRLSPASYSNTVAMTYALTQKKFYLILYVVKLIPVTDLVKQLEAGKRITEKSVVEDMLSKAKDTDIVTTASVLSLKCPLSTLRIDLPCRSIACKHNQCFDATSFLQLQEQGPTWLCPICNRSAPFESLAVDDYVKNILKSTSRSVDQVTVQPDGRWELHTKKENMPSHSNGAGSDSDDDLIEVTKSGGSVRGSAPRSFKTPVSMASRQSREPSTSSGPPKDFPSGSTGVKRSVSAVIDLTSSGDEDEAPLARAPKRQMTSSNFSTPLNVPAFRPPPATGLPPRPSPTTGIPPRTL